MKSDPSRYKDQFDKAKRETQNFILAYEAAERRTERYALEACILMKQQQMNQLANLHHLSNVEDG